MTKPSSEFCELMARVRDGSQDAAWELVARYSELVVRSVRKRLPDDLRRAFDSDDFAQIAWATFFRHPSRVSRLETPGEFVRFMATVAANKVRMEVRKRCVRQKHNVNRERAHDSALELQAGSDPTPSQFAIARERWFRLMEGRPARHQEVIRLRFLSHTMQEIANKLGMNEGSVRRILRNVCRETEL